MNKDIVEKQRKITKELGERMFQSLGKGTKLDLDFCRDMTDFLNALNALNRLELQEAYILGVKDALKINNLYSNN